MKTNDRRLAAVTFSCAIIAAAVTRASPPPLNSTAGVNQGDFRYTTFASGLNYPVGMQQLPDGSILVGTSNPIGNGGFYNSTGSLVRFIDANNDGVADNPAGTAVYSGLPGAVTAVQQAGNLVFVTSSGLSPAITVLKMSSPTAYTLVGTEQFAFPNAADGSGWEHTTYGLAAQPTVGASGSYNVYFNIGSQGDNTTTPAATVVTGTGLFSGSLHGDSVYRVIVNTATATPGFSAPVQIASGLRNAAGLAFQRGTGDLYLDDNGIDNGVNNPTYTNSGVQYSADEINKIPAAQVGVSVPDFGFAHSVILESNGTQSGDGLGVQPLQTFRALPNGTQSEGPNQIAFAPTDFPDGLSGGMFITFHGGPGVGTQNDQNPLVYYNPATNSYYHFIEAGQDGLGHIDGVMSTDTSLFLSDLDPAGSFYDSSGAGTGAIYELTPVPEPGTGAVVVFAAGILSRRRRRCE